MLVYSLEDIKTNKCFFVDYNNIKNDDIFNVEWPSFKAELVENTDYCLDCMSLAMHQCLMQGIEGEHCKEEEQIAVYSFHASSVRARIYNYEPILTIKDLKTYYFGERITLTTPFNYI